MMELLAPISDFIWSETFWLPSGTTYADMVDTPNMHYPKPRDLVAMPIFAMFILLARNIFEVVIVKKMLVKLDVVDRRKKYKPNKVLEEMYSNIKKPNEEQTQSVAKKIDWESSAVNKWFQRRRNADRPSLTKKFSEASWRFVFYLFVFTFGMTTLFQSSWLWDNYQCWVGHPHLNLTWGVYLYYMLEGGFYISLLFTVMTDIRRKDFTEQMIHHLATIFLIVFSYTANFVRVGTLIMAVHDVSDIILEGGKCILYAKYNKIADNVFVVFAVVFIVSRLFVYPYSCLYCVVVRCREILEPFPSWYFFCANLFVLQLLHIFWASIIIKMALTMKKNGNVAKDDRSDSEDELTSD